jgi:hypothetical protein
MNKKIIALSAVFLTLWLTSAVAQAGRFETYIGFTVESPAAVVAALDEFFQSEDSQGYTVHLVASVFDGEDPATHYIVAEYDDYASYEKLAARRPASLAWHQVVQSVLASATPVGNGMGIIRADYGEGWPEQDYVAVIGLAVQDAKKYTKAFDKLSRSKTGGKAPGSTRLFENRGAGAAPSHYAVMSAPSFTALNEHLDRLFASDDYADFADEVEDIRSITSTAIYRKVGSWSN